MDEKNGITFTAADCRYAAPDRVSCDVKVSLKNGTILQLTRVWVPEGTFQSNPLTRQFGKMPPDSNFNGVVLFAKTGIPEILRTSVQKAQVVGQEKIQNRDTLHLKGEVSWRETQSADRVRRSRPDLMYPVDLWMDEQSANTVQIHVTEPDRQRLADRALRHQRTDRHSDAATAAGARPGRKPECRVRSSTRG